MKNYSLAVPTFERYDELQKLLDSISKSVSIYISDNGSTLPASLLQQYSNAVVSKVFPAVLMFPNWNLAANLVQTEWLAIPSDDDIYYPESFQIIERCLEQYADMDMIVFGFNTINADGQVLSSWIPQLETCIAPSGFVNFKYGVDARMPSILIKLKLFKELGGFDEGFRFTAADSEFVQRAALIGDVQFIPEVVAGYRVWEGGMTHNKISSVEWMEEIDRWCHRISSFCKERNINIYSKRINDEIYARNLVGGIIGARKSSGYMAAWAHLTRCRYPFRALVRTQLSLWYKLVKP